MRKGIAIVLLLAAGCMTTTYTPVTRYTIDPAIEPEALGSTGTTLGVRALDPARPYMKANIWYLPATYVLEQYQDAEWAELPGDIVTRALLDGLNKTKRFRDVGDALNVGTPDLTLTGQLRKFRESRLTQPPQAECEIRLELRESLGGKLLWADTLSAAIPVEAEGLPGLAAAMSQAVEQVAEQAVTAIAKATPEKKE